MIPAAIAAAPMPIKVILLVPSLLFFSPLIHSTILSVTFYGMMLKLATSLIVYRQTSKFVGIARFN